MIVLKQQANNLKQVAQQMVTNYDLTEQKWELNDGHYKQSHADVIIRSSTRIITDKILLFSNKESQVLADLLFCSFPNLKIVNLSNNGIVSIQGLDRIDAPHLKSLTLFNNNISSIRCLARINFPNLEQLSLYKNRIVELTPIENMKAQKLKKLFLSCNYAVSVESIVKLNQKGFEQISYRWNQDKNVKLRTLYVKKFPTVPQII